MRPLRVVNVLLLGALLVTVGATYDFKHNAEVATAGIARLQANISSEKDAIRTLNAEWASLNQPSRLEAVVNEHADYFQLQPFSPDQIATIDDIPLRGAPQPAPNVPATASSDSDAAVKATLARIAAGGALRAH
jgi:hypothetical protein